MAETEGKIQRGRDTEGELDILTEKQEVLKEEIERHIKWQRQRKIKQNAKLPTRTKFRTQKNRTIVKVTSRPVTSILLFTKKFLNEF